MRWEFFTKETIHLVSVVSKQNMTVLFLAIGDTGQYNNNDREDLHENDLVDQIIYNVHNDYFYQEPCNPLR